MPDHSRRDFLKSLGVGAAALAASQELRADMPDARRPNIVLIMVDDMGFSDIGCYGGEIRTPNLDRLASRGVRFSQFCNTARCCPTRASLMTGLSPHQTGVGHMMSDDGFDGYRGDLNRSCVTIAEALRPAGYGTYMSGKWHVTRHTGADGPTRNWPRQRGFDRYFGTITGAGSFWTPHTLTRDNERIEAPDEGFYYTDALSGTAIEHMEDHQRERPDAPFFCYVPYTAPHWPLHAPPEDIERYRGTYMRGWDVLREERHARLIEMEMVDGAWPLTPRDGAAAAWENVPRDKQEEMDWRMAIYAAQIDVVDQGVGRIVAALDQMGQLGDTLILFLSDSGGCAEGGPSGFERNEGGVLGEDSSFASYGLSWANASNTPFRLYKHWVHEGGSATPLIAHWPERITAHGAIRHEPGHVIDIMATCLDVAGTEYPREHDGHAIIPLEGKSLVPAFDDRPIGRDAIYWEHEGNRAVRQGKWKVVSKHPGDWELYDMEADRTELTDLADDHPEIAAKLTGMYDAYAKGANVLAWPVRQHVGSRKTEFVLKQGDELPRNDAPRIAGKALTISATVESERPAGVIIAQGGSRVGFSLYVKDGKLAFAVTRNKEKPTIVVGPDALPAGRAQVGARLAKDGAIRLEVDGTQVATGKALGPCNDMPTEGLQVGEDRDGNVGDYKTPHAFQGMIAEVILKLGR